LVGKDDAIEQLPQLDGNQEKIDFKTARFWLKTISTTLENH
jgi:hypothetical protein